VVASDASGRRWPLSPVYEPFERSHLSGVVALCEALAWPSYAADPELTHGALSSPGSTTFVAREGDRIVGLAHVLGDGLIQAHLSLVGVLPGYRRKGIARRLVSVAFERAGGKWMDLAAEAGSEGFYRSFVHRERSGFRIYPKGAPTREA
jgi:ribosomal protein S18 acetylase RimI-like enzyme